MNNEEQNLNAINDTRKTQVLSENDPSILDDLILTAETEADIKAGCTNCNWGPPLINHNETTVSDEEGEAHLDDLKLTDEKSDIIKGGPLCHGVSALAWATVDGRSILR